jgi:hypothetical protein
MTHALTLPAPTGLPALSLTKLIRHLPYRDMLMAGAILISASAILHAQERLEEWTQGWMPAELAVPEDAELLTDREVGSTVRMFSFSTGQDIDALFTEWEAGLEEGGFQIDQAPDELLERSIEFSGTGITNAKIVAGPTDDQGTTVIEVDATLQ